jgi:hypothetical protein
MELMGFFNLMFFLGTCGLGTCGFSGILTGLCFFGLEDSDFLFKKL